MIMDCVIHLTITLFEVVVVTLEGVVVVEVVAVVVVVEVVVEVVVVLEVVVVSVDIITSYQFPSVKKLTKTTAITVLI